MNAQTSSAITPPSLRFPTAGPFEIPELILDRAGRAVDLPVIPWGSVARTTQTRGTWHFYVEDRKFARVWSEPGQIVATGAPTAVEVNFSIAEDDPMPLTLWTVYRKRWVSRFLQHEGVRILVDLFVPEAFVELNLLGVPLGWPGYATRANAGQMALLDLHYECATVHAGGAPEIFLVIGTGSAIREWCANHPGAICNDRLRRPVPAAPGALTGPASMT